MVDDDHDRLLKQNGVATWNAWRNENRNIHPHLREANLSKVDLKKANLRGANLIRANLRGADLTEANLTEANLYEADLSWANLSRANLSKAKLLRANLSRAKLSRADLVDATLREADLSGANLSRADLKDAVLVMALLRDADLSGARLFGADLRRADLTEAGLRRADLVSANLGRADLTEASLNEADFRAAHLEGAQLVDTDLTDADLTGCHIFGISAWRLKLERTKQQSLVITSEDEPEITVDNIEVAQFVYLLLHNEKIRDVIDTVGKKGVLLLGRFTEGRIEILERLREELRNRGYLPIIFNFDKPETKNFTETVRLLAGLSHFVIADVTNPKSAPLELQATVPEVMVPFRPIIQEGEKPFAMLEDLWIQHRDWVFEPLYYSSLDALVGALDEKIIKPAKARFVELLARKAEKMKGEHV
jgi:uncharacterized protein YjbI with pentapeptide repeats